MTYTISQFKKNFPDDNACLDFLFKARFSGFKCPKCGRGKFYRIKNRKCYNCISGDYQIYPLKGTIFSRSSTSLFNWFYALYMFSVSKNGVSAKKIQEVLGITYKTAWRIAYLIRTLMSQDTDRLEKIVEIDEMYVGGKRKQSRVKDNKSTVMGMVQRGGKVKAKYIKEYWTPTALKIIEDNVKWGTRLITDDSSILRKTKRLGYLQDTIVHSKKEYVRGDIHTNTIEGFWSQIKRSFDGTYHAVSSKYLQLYINEFAYRYNHRYASVSVFEALLLRLCGLPDEEDHKISLGVSVSS